MGRKWANIVAKKTKNDGATSAKNAKFGVELYVAAKRGGSTDPEANSQLKFTIEKAKQAQVPRHVIENALKKAEGKSDETFVEGRYEGFGPNGSMIVCETLTPNVNRTIADIRTIFHKNGGNIGAAGSVSYMFDNTGVIVFKGDDSDHIFEVLLDGEIDVRDVVSEEGYITVTTEPAELHKAISVLKADGISEFEETDLELIAQSEVSLSDEDLAVFEGLIDALEDNEDVQKVYHNVENME
ncbi:YebC/PmpR family DNA-binding transcriptional regulator [Lactococcus hircilactis]|uniref:Probable transcriptional regulatory protein GHI93_06090 n=1 Tax=Lactococcus hircilactis TaxID=1494462 RepID=A0A7X1Z7Y9_9LACT|nr:YebC/PmpR family DNA-binding transcriptional regulator [Lactococcus hircilactis]MQW39509.1 YebC/PmpR family DNA-binding transcriptional regulator [Lactococcus hircilactis]